MEAHDLIAKAHADGLHLRVEGERLWVGPSDRVTPALIAELKHHKAQIIDLLSRSGPTSSRPVDAVLALSRWVGCRVICPVGIGLLVSVARCWAMVRSEDAAGRLMVCLPAEIHEPGRAGPIVDYEPEVH